MSWNDRQQKAIEMRGRSVVVSAAAGSGKTSVLTERVLRLIEEGADLERMLIVTFTNLAAGEMKERIFRRLQEAGGARLNAQAEKCAFADISTIHAFCGRVIRDNFIEAGVSPLFSVADEAAISAMKERAMDEAVTSAAQDKSYIGFISRFSPRGDMQGQGLHRDRSALLRNGRRHRTGNRKPRSGNPARAAATAIPAALVTTSQVPSRLLRRTGPAANGS
jgi:ATP-dependent helicase/nuclease subunit A